MQKVVNNAITLTRGDTFIAVVSLTRDGEAYVPQEGDSIKFALKKATMNPTKTAYTDKEPLIEKSVPIASMTLQLDPIDTKSLPFGDYVYDLELTFANGVVDTFIAGEPFIITPEIA